MKSTKRTVLFSLILAAVTFISGCYISWSPDGKKILFTALNKEIFTNALYSINSDGTGVKQLLSPFEKAAYPSFMSETKLCYVSARSNPEKARPKDSVKIALTTLDLASNERKDIVTLLPEIDDREVFREIGMFLSCTPSPDGRWIVYQNAELEKDASGKISDVITSLWLLDVTSGEIRRMTEKNEKPMFPVWAPDSKQFAYCAPLYPKDTYGYPGENCFIKQPPEIWVMDIQGHKKKVSNFEKSGLSGALSMVAWSPDGRQLAYVTFPGPKGLDVEGTKSDLYVLTLQTGKEEVLFDAVDSSSSGSRPRWSPDGKTILSEGTLFDLSAHTRTSYKGHFAAWSPDGKRIAMWSTDEGGLVSFDPRDRTSTQLLFEGLGRKRNKAYGRLQKGDYRGAVTLMEEIMKIGEPEPNTIFSDILGIFRQVGQLQEGALWGEKNNGYCRSTNDQLALADIYARAGSYDKAIEVYNEIYEKYGNGNEGRNSFVRYAKADLDFIRNTPRKELDAYYTLYNAPVPSGYSPATLAAVEHQLARYNKMLDMNPGKQYLKEHILVQTKILENRIQDIKETLERK